MTELHTVAALFVRADSIYKTMPRVDCWDIERDARLYGGNLPVVAHPPCRAWGALSYFAKPRPDEKELAIFAVNQVRKNGGVLEHPARSKLWEACNLPLKDAIDEYGGFTLPIAQHWFGHRAEKLTKLYIVGLHPSQIPAFPMVLGDSTHVIATSRNRRKNGKRLRSGMQGWRPEVSKAEREHTPPLLAEWLVDLAERCSS